MKKIVSLFILLFIAKSILFSQGIEFFHGKWSEALERAAKEDKLIFVDAYTKWCGPCKRMAAETFTQEKAGAFYNKNFICVKMDMEDAENMEFIEKFPVSSYPTLMFIDGKGKITKKTVGFQDIASLLSLGKSALSSLDNSAEFEKKYTAGDRTPELVYSYIKALNRAGKPTLKIANEYLLKQKDLKTPENLKIIFEAATEADSRIFDLLVQNKAQISTLMTESAVNDRITSACENTVDKAIKFKNDQLFEEAKMKLKKNYPAKADAFGIDSDLKYYLALKNPKKYLDACESCVRDEIKSNAGKLHDLVMEMTTNFKEDTKVMKAAEKFAKQAAENGGLPNYYLSYAQILLHNGKKSDAKKTAEKALELAKQKAIETGQIEYFLQKLG
jgi:thiol-disulfide isomerase/thioredoxin